MIAAFSSSSPVASVALLSRDGQVLAVSESAAGHSASQVLIEGLQACLAERGASLSEIEGVAADVGPGSFIGVRVAVTMAKTLGYTLGVPCFGATSFDLIDPNGAVAFPSKRGEWFVRRPGEPAGRVAALPEEPLTGFGPGFEHTIYPLARAFGVLLEGLEPIDPMLLMPQYLIEPSISQPKVPYAEAPR